MVDHLHMRQPSPQFKKEGYAVKEARDGVERAYLKLVLQNDAVATEELTEITGRESNKLFPTDIGMLGK